MSATRFFFFAVRRLDALLPEYGNWPMGMLSQNVPHYRNVSRESLAWLAGLASLQKLQTKLLA